MTVQENFTEKYTIARNYVTIRQFVGKTQEQVVKETRIPKQNISSWENNKSNPGKKYIGRLSKYFGLPREVFYMDPLTTEDLEKMKNGTDEGKEPAINGKDSGEAWEAAAFRKIIEGDAQYVLVHKNTFENNRFTSVEQIEAQARELAETRADVQRLVRDFIEFVKDTRGLGRATEPPKIEETKKDASV